MIKNVISLNVAEYTSGGAGGSAPLILKSQEEEKLAEETKKKTVPPPPLARGLNLLLYRLTSASSVKNRTEESYSLCEHRKQDIS